MEKEGGLLTAVRLLGIPAACRRPEPSNGKVRNSAEMRMARRGRDGGKPLTDRSAPPASRSGKGEREIEKTKSYNRGKRA